MNFFVFYEKSKNILPGGWTNGFSAKKYENYSGRFPDGVPKAEIQQWRQVRSRPGEKETLNIMLREIEKSKKWFDMFGLVS